jgi:hypothetical protein
MDNSTELIDRLQRLETRLVRGFNEIGVDVTKSAQGISVYATERRIVLPSLTVTVANIFRAAIDSGLRVGYSEITVEYDGNKLFQL